MDPVASVSVRLAVCGVLLSLIACSDRVVSLARDPRDAASADTSTPIDARVPAQCGDVVCACDNGLDDDEDGLIDGFDPECTGALDHDERSFATGTIDAGTVTCQDCFFDSNTESDDDGCELHAQCLYGEPPAMPGAGECNTCDVTKRCEDACRPRTPNGCDCFGCCTVDIKGQPKINIRLQDSCSLALLMDEAACPRCMPNDACRNPCGRCELCPGRTEADLPADCSDMPRDPGHKCDDSEAVCTSDKPCGAGFYCQQGCCLPLLE